MKTVFSGIQPSGALHRGSYLGAVRNRVKLQEQYRGIFGVVDHPAPGIDPDRSLLFLRIREVLEQGAAKARAVAERTTAQVHDKLGPWRSH